jgi:hypothetical protein
LATDCAGFAVVGRSAGGWRKAGRVEGSLATAPSERSPNATIGSEKILGEAGSVAGLLVDFARSGERRGDDFAMSCEMRAGFADGEVDGEAFVRALEGESKSEPGLLSRSAAFARAAAARAELASAASAAAIAAVAAALSFAEPLSCAFC